MITFGLKKALNSIGNLTHKKKRFLFAIIGVMIIILIIFSMWPKRNPVLTSEEVILLFSNKIEEFTKSADALLNGFMNYDETVEPEGRHHIYFSKEDFERARRERSNISNRLYYQQFLTQSDWETVEDTITIIPHLLGIRVQIAGPHYVDYEYYAEADDLVVLFAYYDPRLSTDEKELLLRYHSQQRGLLNSPRVIDGTGWIIRVFER